MRTPMIKSILTLLVLVVIGYLLAEAQITYVRGYRGFSNGVRVKGVLRSDDSLHAYSIAQVDGKFTVKTIYLVPRAVAAGDSVSGTIIANSGRGDTLMAWNGSAWCKFY